MNLVGLRHQQLIRTLVEVESVAPEESCGAVHYYQPEGWLLSLVPPVGSSR